MATDNSKYSLKQGETPEQYFKRNNVNEMIANATKPTAPTVPTPTTGTTSSDALMTELQNKLSTAAEGISSSSSNIESTITDAINSQEKIRASGERRINSDFGSERNFLTGQIDATLTNSLEGRSGFGTQVAALRNLTESTDKQLRDLEVRRQDALMANDAATAAEISKLQMSKLEYQDKAQMNYFNSLLGLTNIAQGQQKMELDQKNNAFNQGMSLADYSLKVKEEARSASYDDWKRKFDEEQFAFTQKSTLFEQQQSQVRLNIMQSELKLKQVEAGKADALVPDAGYGSFEAQSTIGKQVNAELAAIMAKVGSQFKEGSPEHSAATIAAYMRVRREHAQSAVTNDALAKSFGLKFGDDGELGMIQAEKPDTNFSGGGGGSGGGRSWGEDMASSFPWLTGMAFPKG